ncbi:MAG: hypothetical protein AUH85_18525 [Chloroflexi bacterium 13_1_40CM_4_68_4]|nr:MAG: hypothetical protein AUH85_18525 [Chloroflexi bacterium 13_1_40CM_4_68_4]
MRVALLSVRESCERILAERGTGRARLHVMRTHPMLQSPAVRSDADAASYRSLFGSLREHVRAYITKQLLLPRQEITELIRANLRAAMWFGIAAALLFFGVIALLVLLIALLALLPREWLGALVFALATGVGVAVLFAGVRSRSLGTALLALVAGLVIAAIGLAAYLFLPELALAAMLVTLILIVGGALCAVVGYRRLELRAPERSIRSVKETITWVRATLLGRSGS